MFDLMLGRLAGLVATFLVAAILVFVLADFAVALRDGDPMALGGLLVGSFENLVRGDLGTSSSLGVPVAALVVERLWLTLGLAAGIGLFSTLLGGLLGLLAGLRPGTLTERVLMVLFRVLSAAPPVFVGMLLMLAFAVGLHWLPPGGFLPFTEDLGGAVRSLILPVAALTLPVAAVLAKSIHDALTDAQGTDFLLAARSRGMTTGEVLFRHSIRQTLPQALSGFGRHLGVLAASVPVIEAVFYLPGLGRLAFGAVADQDIPLIRGSVLLLLALALLATIIGSITFAAAEREAPQPERRRAPAAARTAAVRSVPRGVLVGGASAAGIVALLAGAMLVIPYSLTQTVAAAGPVSSVDPGLFATLSRDLGAQVLAAGFESMAIVGLAVLIGVVIGVPAGLFTVRGEGFLNWIVRKSTTFLTTIPTLLLLLGLAVLVPPGVGTLTAILALVFTAFIAQATGSAGANWLRQGYVDAARMAGLSRRDIMLRHVAPHLLMLVLARASGLLAAGLLAEAALSFVGLGAASSTLGAMLASGHDTLLQSAYPAMLGGVAVTALVLFFSLLSDALRRHVDPEVRWRGALNVIA